MLDISNLLEQTKTIAIVGCSASKNRTSYQIASYLQKYGYTIIPINPNYDEILGEECYNSINEIDSDITIDIVNIFRNKRFTADMVKDIITWSQDAKKKPVIWTQLNVSSKEAEKLADEADLPYIKNRCIMVEHDRYIR